MRRPAGEHHMNAIGTLYQWYQYCGMPKPRLPQTVELEKFGQCRFDLPDVLLQQSGANKRQTQGVFTQRCFMREFDHRLCLWIKTRSRTQTYWKIAGSNRNAGHEK